MLRILSRRAAAAATAAALLLAACSADDASDTSEDADATASTENDGDESTESDEDSTDASGEESVDVVSIATEKVAPYTQRPTEPEVTEPITGEIPTGLTLDFLTCSSPGCAAIAEAFTDAAELLGWEVKVLTVAPEAEAIQEAYNTAIRDEPDGVAVAAVSSDPVRTELAQLEEMGIPVVTVQDPDEAFGPIIAALYTHPSSIKLGELTADYLISKGCMDGHTIYVNLSGYIVLDFRLEGFEAELAELAPDFSYEVLQLPASEPNPAAAIVGAARANNDVECVYLSSDHYTPGLPQAFESAGMDIPKIITDYGGATTLQYIRDGLVTATNVGDSGSYGWIYMDAFARHFAGQSTAPSEAAFQSVWFVDSENLPDDVPYSHVEDLPSKYAEVWGVG